MRPVAAAERVKEQSRGPGIRRQIAGDVRQQEIAREVDGCLLAPGEAAGAPRDVDRVASAPDETPAPARAVRSGHDPHVRRIAVEQQPGQILLYHGSRVPSALQERGQRETERDDGTVEVGRGEGRADPLQARARLHGLLDHALECSSAGPARPAALRERRRSVPDHAAGQPDEPSS